MQKLDQPATRRFTVELDLETYKRLRNLATEELRPMAKVLRDAVRNHLDLHEPKR